MLGFCLASVCLLPLPSRCGGRQRIIGCQNVGLRCCRHICAWGVTGSSCGDGHEHPCSLPFCMCFMWALCKLVLARTRGKHSEAESPCSSHVPCLSRVVEQLDKNQEKGASFPVIKTSPGPSFCLRKIPARSQRDDSVGSFCWRIQVQSPAPM